MGTLEQRIAALEQRIGTKDEWRPRPLSFLYGEPLPDDFYTNPKYIRKPGEKRTLADFYAEYGKD